MSYRCLGCKGIIYDRSVNVCPHCGAELPPISLFIPSEVTAPDKSDDGIEVPVTLLARARVELSKARGDPKASRRAAIRYCKEGFCSGFPSHLLFRWLFSWPNERESVFSQVGYSAQAGKEFIEMLKRLTLREVLDSDDETPATFSAISSDSNMSADKASSEARARVIWDESSSSVREFLIENGFSDLDADAKINEFSRERNSEIRRIGIKNAVIGAAILVAEGITFYPSYKYFDSISYTGGAKIIMLYSIGGLYGLWRLVKGVSYLLRPQSEKRSITDI